MTVCLAAFAENHKAIVCIADKGISYGDHIQWDSDGTKIAPINDKGTTVLFSGGEEATGRVLTSFVAHGDELGDDANQTLKKCEEYYAAEMQELIEARLLRPNLLSRTDYLEAIKAPSLNDHIYSLATKVADFDMSCDVVVCGFDAKNTPFILNIAPPGVGTNFWATGFHAVGSGWDKAVARLLFSEHKRTHPVHRAVYDVFDAKANAEMSAGVGYEWDAKVLYRNRCIFDFAEDPKKLIEQVWAKCNRSPFEKRTKDDIAQPPRDWKDAFEDISGEMERLSNTPPTDKSKGWPKARPFTSVLRSKPSVVQKSASAR